MIEKLILFCIENKRFTTTLFLIATLSILILTTLPPDQLGSSKIYEYDKPAHFLIFFGWTLLLGLFMFSRRKTETKLILVFIIGCLFGIAIEVLQELLPIGRNMDIRDAYSDILGSFISFLLLFLIKRKYLSREFEQQLEKIDE